MKLLIIFFQIAIVLSGSGIWIIGIAAAAGGKDRFLSGLAVLYACVSVRIAIAVAYIAVFELTELYLLLAADQTAGLWIMRTMLTLGEIADCALLVLASLMAGRRLGLTRAGILVWASAAWSCASAAAYTSGIFMPIPRGVNTVLNCSYIIVFMAITMALYFRADKSAPIGKLIHQGSGAAAFLFLPLRLAIVLADGLSPYGISPHYFIYLDLFFYLALNLRLYAFMASTLRRRGEKTDIGRLCLEYRFSARERQIAELLLLDRSYKHIAESLFISIDTVKSHAKSVYRKTKTRNRSSLMLKFRGSP